MRIKSPPSRGHLNGVDLDSINQARDELVRARMTYSDFSSPHEGYAILLEEVEELWAEVMKKPAKRDKLKLRMEARQIAAMALRFMTDCC